MEPPNPRKSGAITRNSRLSALDLRFPHPVVQRKSVHKHHRHAAAAILRANLHAVNFDGVECHASIPHALAKITARRSVNPWTLLRLKPCRSQRCNSHADGVLRSLARCFAHRVVQAGRDTPRWSTPREGRRLASGYGRKSRGVPPAPDSRSAASAGCSSEPELPPGVARIGVSEPPSSAARSKVSSCRRMTLVLRRQLHGLALILDRASPRRPRRNSSGPACRDSWAHRATARATACEYLTARF